MTVLAIDPALKVLAVAAGAVLAITVATIVVLFLLERVVGPVRYHSRAAQHVARQEDNPDVAPPLIDDDYVTPYPAPPHPGGEVTK